MPELVCGFCSVNVGCGVSQLTHHLRYYHHFTISSMREFRCGQEGCALRFQHYRSLKRHLYSSHRDVALDQGLGAGCPVEDAGMEDERMEDEQMEDETTEDETTEDAGVEAGQHFPEEEDQFPEENMNQEDENEDVPKRSLPGLSRMAADMVVDMRSNSSVTGTTMSRTFEYSQKCVEVVVETLKTEVREVLVAGNVDPEIILAVEKKFNVKNPFEKLETIEQSISALKEHYQFVDPVKVELGTRVEYVKDRTGEYVPKMVKDTYQYVPILQVIEMVLANPAIRDLIVSEQDAAAGFLEKFRDGDRFKNHTFFAGTIGGLQLQIYYDDLEVVNALGSRTIVHKLGAFYFRLLNLPHFINSSLGSIHLFLLCYSNDLKKYSFSRVLRLFVEDVKKLENGVRMRFGEEEMLVSGAIAAVCGDGLAVHELFGLLGPQCRMFCRECFITREDLLNRRAECVRYRNKEEYAERLLRLKAHPHSAAVKTETGLYDECILDETKFFHHNENHVFDATHDFAEGICPYEVKLVLNFYVGNGFFDLSFFNGRVHSMSYGVTEVKNKPSSNFTLANLQDTKDHKLKQKAAQMMLLVRALPFLLSDKVPEGDPHMKLILLLLKIMGIIFAPRLHQGTLAMLEVLIREHHALYAELFPTANLINKHHHITHYPRFIQKMGPAVHHSCIRFEGKHHDLVRHGAVCCNFRNIPKTLARVCQIIQAKHWGDPEKSPWEEIDVSGGERRLVAELPYCNELVANFEVRKEGNVLVCGTAEVRGTKYERNTFVVLQNGMEHEESFPTFGEISEIVIIHSSAAVLVVVPWTTSFYNGSLGAYAVEEGSGARIGPVLVLTWDLPDYRPISAWNSFRGDDAHIYLCPRTSFF